MVVRKHIQNAIGASRSPSVDNVPTTDVCVVVVGTGFIGSSFCAVFLAHKKQVVCVDPFADESALQERIRKHWPSIRSRGLTKLSQPPLDRLIFETDVTQAVQQYRPNFIQECTSENIQLKQSVLAELDRLTDPENTIIASSTSFIPHDLLVTNCGKNKERILIGHPSIPHLDCFMEIYGTSSEWVGRTRDWYLNSGFNTIVMRKTLTGHVFNSFLLLNMQHGNKLVRDGVCSPEDVNTALRHMGRNFHARNSFLTLMSAIGGDNGLQGGLELNDKIQLVAVSTVFFSLMKKLWMPDWIAKAVGNAMGHLLRGIVVSPPPEEWILACQEHEDKLTQNGKVDVTTGLFEHSVPMYERVPYEINNDPFKL